MSAGPKVLPRAEMLVGAPQVGSWQRRAVGHRDPPLRSESCAKVLTSHRPDGETGWRRPLRRASHELERRAPALREPETREAGASRSDRAVHGSDVRPMLEVETPQEPQDSAQSSEGHRDCKLPGPLCPSELCAEESARRRDGEVHGPDARPMLEVEASHEPQDSAQSLEGHRGPRNFRSLCPPELCAQTVGRRPDSQVQGPNARPRLEVETPPKAGCKPALRRNDARALGNFRRASRLEGSP